MQNISIGKNYHRLISWGKKSTEEMEKKNYIQVVGIHVLIYISINV